MRNALNALALLLGFAVLIGTAIPAPAGAQDAAEDDGGESAPETAPPEREPADAPEGAPSAETPDAEETPEPAAPDPTEPVTAEPATAPETAAPDAAEPGTTAGTDTTEPATTEPATTDTATDTATLETATPEPAPAATPDQAATESTEQGAPTDPAIEGDTTEGEAEADPAEEEAPAPAGPALTFSNSFFNYTNQVTFNSFAPGGQLTYNPWWQMNFSLTPRFYLTDTTFLWLNQGVAVEMTRSDWTTYANEPILTDTTLDIRQNIRWEGFVFQLQGRLAFPLSKASQSAERILQTGVGLSVARPFPELASLTIGATFGYRRWWATSNVARIQPGSEPDYDDETPYGETFCEAGIGAGGSICTQAGSQTTARDILVAGLSLTIMPVSGLTLQFQGVYLGMYGYHIATAIHDIQGRTLILEDDSPTHWRHFTYFALAVGYQIIPSLNVSLGIQNAANVAPFYSPDGSVRSPFNPDTSVFLTATVGIDTLVKELTGESDDDLTPEERQRRRQGLARRGTASSF